MLLASRTDDMVYQMRVCVIFFFGKREEKKSTHITHNCWRYTQQVRIWTEYEEHIRADIILYSLFAQWKISRTFNIHVMSRMLNDNVMFNEFIELGSVYRFLESIFGLAWKRNTQKSIEYYPSCDERWIEISMGYEVWERANETERWRKEKKKRTRNP